MVQGFATEGEEGFEAGFVKAADDELFWVRDEYGCCLVGEDESWGFGGDSLLSWQKLAGRQRETFRLTE